MNYVYGDILTEKGFEKGYLYFDNKKIIEKGRKLPSSKPVAQGIITPLFINSHTHIGDSFIKNKDIHLPKDIDKLVGPNGIKHRLLNNTIDEDIIEGMETSIEYMTQSGTQVFCDFRENGILGICQLKSALKFWNISSIILSRPDKNEYDKGEMDLLLKNSDGIGLSSISDWDYTEIEKISKDIKKKKKVFAIHCSERIREDIDKVLDLKPDFLVHMIKASKSDLEKVKDDDIPIVLCPRSNSFFGLKPNYDLLKKIGIDILLGTDNAMLNSPGILEDLKYIKSMSSIFSDEELLHMITYSARKALNLGPSILGPGYPADFVVLDKKTLKILYISNSK